MQSIILNTYCVSTGLAMPLLDLLPNANWIDPILPIPTLSCASYFVEINAITKIRAKTVHARWNTNSCNIGIHLIIGSGDINFFSRLNFIIDHLCYCRLLFIFFHIKMSKQQTRLAISGETKYLNAIKVGDFSINKNSSVAALSFSGFDLMCFN